MSRQDLSLLAKMSFANVIPISAHRSVRALNSSLESLSEDNTSTAQFLHNSVRKFFTKVSFPMKNSKRAANKRDETSPSDFIQKHFAKSSLRINFLPTFLGGVSPSGTNR